MGKELGEYYGIYLSVPWECLCHLCNLFLIFIKNQKWFWSTPNPAHKYLSSPSERSSPSSPQAILNCCAHFSILLTDRHARVSKLQNKEPIKSVGGGVCFSCLWRNTACAHLSFEKVKFEEAEEEEEKNIQYTWQFYLDFQSPYTIINNDSLFLYKTREVVTHLWDKIPV